MKVLDFGLVAARAGGERGNTQLTRQGMVTGTPAFMAPELIYGERVVDPRVDIYALGCVGYWLLTGRLVFEAESPMAILVMHAKEIPHPPSSRIDQPINSNLERVLMNCLSKDPAERPQTARALSDALRQSRSSAEPWTEERAEEWWRAHSPNRG